MPYWGMIKGLAGAVPGIGSAMGKAESRRSSREMENARHASGIDQQLADYGIGSEMRPGMDLLQESLAFKYGNYQTITRRRGKHRWLDRIHENYLHRNEMLAQAQTETARNRREHDRQLLLMRL